MKNLIICASPRQGGNSDFATSLLAEKLDDCQIIKLLANKQENYIQTCISCGYCEQNKGICTFNRAGQDLAGEIFSKIFQAEQIYFVSPIYFYHLPAQLKALMDRSQAWFFLPKDQKPIKSKPCKIILIGARNKGENLFSGSILSFKYFCDALGFAISNPLCLYGLDQKDDLKNNIQSSQQIIDYI